MSSNEVAQELALFLPNENLHEGCFMKIALALLPKLIYFSNKNFCSGKNKASLFIN